MLAEKCAFQGGLTTYECDLRRGVKFHNGRTIRPPPTSSPRSTASIKIQDASGIYTLLGNLESVDAKGDFNVTST